MEREFEFCFYCVKLNENFFGGGVNVSIEKYCLKYVLI